MSYFLPFQSKFTVCVIVWEFSALSKQILSVDDNMKLYICVAFISAEILDFGYPQNTDMGVLKTLITQAGIKSQVGQVLELHLHDITLA